ncbi:hypothetical protein STEG23_011848, partial [Scotinomys teguina]
MKMDKLNSFVNDNSCQAQQDALELPNEEVTASILLQEQKELWKPNALLRTVRIAEQGRKKGYQ